MSDHDDAQRLRDAHDARRPRSPMETSSSRSAMVGQVATTAAIGSFMEVVPTRIGGPAYEAGSATFTRPDPAARISVLVLGPTAPPLYAYILCRFVDFRWVAQSQFLASGAWLDGQSIHLKVLACGNTPGAVGNVATYVEITTSSGAYVVGDPSAHPARYLDQDGYITISPNYDGSAAMADGSTYEITVYGYGSPRWSAPTSFVFNSAGPTVNLAPAPGYNCLAPVCSFPLSNRMVYTDDSGDSWVLVWIAGSQSYLSPAAGSPTVQLGPSGFVIFDTASGLPLIGTTTCASSAPVVTTWADTPGNATTRKLTEGTPVP